MYLGTIKSSSVWTFKNILISLLFCEKKKKSLTLKNLIEIQMYIFGEDKTFITALSSEFPLQTSLQG